MFDWSGEASLASLFVAAFVSATLLPANSEIVLVAVLLAFPERAFEALALATLGNTLGGATTYGIGRIFPPRKDLPPRILAWVRRFGAWTLLLSWVPLVGDALCAAAGWLRVSFWRSLLAMAVGKFLRYFAIAQALAWW
jgi:membrane protein YqaA with SNARE-associated domain